MSSAARVGEVLRLELKVAWLIVVLGLFCLVAGVAQATRLGMLPMILGLVLVSLAALVSLRWPLLPLVLFVALIPIEELVVVDGFGTISKLAAILFAVTYGVPRLGNLALAAARPAAWAYLAWSVVSIGWALSPDAALAQIATLLQLFVVAILIADVVVQRPAVVRPLLWVYSLSAAATALVGIQYFVAAGTRAAAVDGQDPAQFAAVLLPAFVFGLYEVLNGERRILGGTVAALATAGLVVSGTRGAWLGAIVVILLFVLPRLPLRRQIAAIAVILLMGFVTLQIPGVSDLLAQRAGTAVSSGGSGRTDIWRVGVTLFESNPVFGVGYANFAIADTMDAVRAADVSASHVGGGPHNLVIGTVVELGSVGLLLLGLFLLPLVLRRGWGPDAAIVQAALASLLVAALFLDILSDRKQVWLFIGLAWGLAFLRRNHRTVQSDGAEATMEVDPVRLPARDASPVFVNVASVPRRRV